MEPSEMEPWSRHESGSRLGCAQCKPLAERVGPPLAERVVYTPANRSRSLFFAALPSAPAGRAGATGRFIVRAQVKDRTYPNSREVLPNIRPTSNRGRPRVYI